MHAALPFLFLQPAARGCPLLPPIAQVSAGGARVRIPTPPKALQGALLRGTAAEIPRPRIAAVPARDLNLSAPMQL